MQPFPFYFIHLCLVFFSPIMFILLNLSSKEKTKYLTKTYFNALHTNEVTLKGLFFFLPQSQPSCHIILHVKETDTMDKSCLYMSAVQRDPD